MPAEISQISGVVNSFFGSMVARRMPRMIMHSGVDMAPSVRKPPRTRSGSQVLAFSRYRTKPAAAASTEGLTRAARSEMYFFSPVRVNTPTVQATIFRDTLNIQE